MSTLYRLISSIISPLLNSSGKELTFEEETWNQILLRVHTHPSIKMYSLCSLDKSDA